VIPGTWQVQYHVWSAVSINFERKPGASKFCELNRYINNKSYQACKLRLVLTHNCSMDVGHGKMWRHLLCATQCSGDCWARAGETRAAGGCSQGEVEVSRARTRPADSGVLDSGSI
jgi:hypothetical protein